LTSRDDRSRRAGPGVGLTALANTSLVVLDREHFLSVVTAHPESIRTASVITITRLGEADRRLPRRQILRR
jgi:hypothetical protein